jgi:hypothetical protein
MVTDAAKLLFRRCQDPRTRLVGVFPVRTGRFIEFDGALLGSQC